MMSKRRRKRQSNANSFMLSNQYNEEFIYDGILYSVCHKLNDMVYAVAVKKGKLGKLIAGGAIEHFSNGKLIPNPRKSKRELSELNASNNG